jgi:hypothetical protein
MTGGDFFTFCIMRTIAKSENTFFSPLTKQLPLNFDCYVANVARSVVYSTNHRMCTYTDILAIH